MKLKNRGQRPIRNMARTESVLESLDLTPVEDLVDVADVVEDTVDAVEVGLDILSDILDGNEFLPEVIEDEHTLEDHIEEDHHDHEDEGSIEVVMESIRNRRIKARKSNESATKSGRIRVRANEALELKETCPACGSKTFNERSKTCNVCKLGVKAVLAAESVAPKVRKKSRRRNESEEYYEDEELALIELEDGAIVDADDDFAVVDDGDVNVELADATHTLLLDVEDDNGDDDVEELSLSTGVVSTEDGDLAVVLFDDELVSDVVDILLGENSSQVEVVDTDLGTDLIVQVVSEEVLESGEVEVFEEDPVVIHIEETSDGAVIHTNEFDDVEDLLDFVEDLVGESGEVIEAGDESDSFDDEEEFEEPQFDDEEDEVVLESATKRRVRGRR